MNVVSLASGCSSASPSVRKRLKESFNQSPKKDINRYPVEDSTSVRSRVNIVLSGTTNHKEVRIKRFPINQNFIASCLAAEKKGIVVDHPAKELFPNILCNSIVKMVTLICNKYVVSNRVELNDLVQDCFLRIMKRIETYDYRRSVFTTWCWRVCMSTMNSRYRKNMLYSSRFLPIEDIDDFSGTDNKSIQDNVTNDDGCSSILGKDIVITIKEMMEKHPEKKKLIIGIFGNPNDEKFCFPDKIKMSKIARDTGVNYREAQLFYKNVIQKTFKEKFATRSEI